MSLAADEFWKAVDRWKFLRVPIVVEFVRSTVPRLRERFTGVVIGAKEPLVSFRDVKTGEVHPIDFGGADISIGGFELIEPLGMMRVFNVAWEDADLLSCAMMEPRETSIAN